MSDTVTFAVTFARINGSENAPAVFIPGWLPDGDFFPELTDARETYLRLQAALTAAGERGRAIEGRIESDKTRRDAALRCVTHTPPERRTHNRRPRTSR